MQVENVKKAAKVAGDIGMIAVETTSIYAKLGGKALEKGVPILKDALSPVLKSSKTAWQETVELAEVVVPAVPKLIQGVSQDIATGAGGAKEKKQQAGRQGQGKKNVGPGGKQSTVTAEVVTSPKKQEVEEKASDSVSASSSSTTTQQQQEETVITEEVVTRTEVTTEMKAMRVEETMSELSSGTVIKKKKKKDEDDE